MKGLKLFEWGIVSIKGIVYCSCNWECLDAELPFLLQRDYVLQCCRFQNIFSIMHEKTSAARASWVNTHITCQESIISLEYNHYRNTITSPHSPLSFPLFIFIQLLYTAHSFLQVGTLNLPAERCNILCKILPVEMSICRPVFLISSPTTKPVTRAQVLRSL